MWSSYCAIVIQARPGPELFRCWAVSVRLSALNSKHRTNCRLHNTRQIGQKTDNTQELKQTAHLTNLQVKAWMAKWRDGCRKSLSCLSFGLQRSWVKVLKTFAATQLSNLNGCIKRVIGIHRLFDVRSFHQSIYLTQTLRKFKRSTVEGVQYKGEFRKREGLILWPTYENQIEYWFSLDAMMKALPKRALSIWN